jgi:NTP pyrophosphatase (non-canonical NTP hydrolase)
METACPPAHPAKITRATHYDQVQSTTQGGIVTPRQQELLDLLQEEAAEVIQAVSKVRRFGETATNMGNLHTEIGDFMGVFKEIVAEGIISEQSLLRAAEAKIIKMERYMKNKRQAPK